jgi:hypothetical protein
MDAQSLHDLVASKYTTIATQPLSSVTPCAQKVSTEIGYSNADLSSVPEGANLGLGCGAPVSAAELKPVFAFNSIVIFMFPIQIRPELSLTDSVLFRVGIID